MLRSRPADPLHRDPRDLVLGYLRHMHHYVFTLEEIAAAVQLDIDTARRVLFTLRDQNLIYADDTAYWMEYV
jgi:hypothetical protein